MKLDRRSLRQVNNDRPTLAGTRCCNEALFVLNTGLLNQDFWSGLQIPPLKCVEQIDKVRDLLGSGHQQGGLPREWDASAVIEPLFAAFGTALGLELPTPHMANAHRWRYALAAEAMHAGALSDPSRQLALGGDWCQGSRVEGAYLSGLALAASAAGFVSAAGR